MENVLLIYIILQLLATAFGLAVLDSVKPLVDRNPDIKYSLLNLSNSTVVNVLKGFIPFYYFSKGIKIIMNKKLFDEKVTDRNENIPVKIEIPDIQIIDDDARNSLGYILPKDVARDESQKYTARKNNINLLETNNQEDFAIVPCDDIDLKSMTPFTVDYPKIKKDDIKQSSSNENISKEDIARAITDLNIKELESLKESISELQRYKESMILKLKKDIA